MISLQQEIQKQEQQKVLEQSRPEVMLEAKKIQEVNPNKVLRAILVYIYILYTYILYSVSI